MIPNGSTWYREASLSFLFFRNVTCRFSLIADLYLIYALINASQTKYHSLSDLAEQKFRIWM